MPQSSIRLHGDAPLIDPELLKGYCSNCKHEREWRIIETNDEKGTFIKACKTCGVKILAKLPKSVYREESGKAGDGNLIQKIVREISKLTSK